MEYIILTGFFVYILARAFSGPRKGRTRAAPPGRREDTQAAERRQQLAAERQERKEQQQRLAAIEYEHRAALKELYSAEAARVEKELCEETGRKIRERLKKQLAILDEKSYKNDMQMIKAFDKMGGLEK